MIKTKNKNIFKAILLYILNIVVLSPVVIYGGQNFSIDSYGIVLDYNVHLKAFVESYRWFGAFVYKLYYDIFNHNPILDSTIDSIVFIVSVAVIIVCFSFVLYKLINKNSFLTYIAINLSVLITVLNVWFCDVLSFPECIFITAIGVVLCFAALIVFIKMPDIKGYILSAVFIILSTGIYQQFLFIFAIYVVVICSLHVVKNNESNIKQLFLRYIKPIILIITSGGLYFIAGKIIQIILNVEQNSRVALSLSSIIENCLYFAKNQHSYLKGRGFFNSEILTVCFMVAGLIWFVVSVLDWKKNKNTLKTVVLWLSFVCAYISAYVPGILSTSHAARAMFALFSAFALFAIGALILTDNKYIKIVLCAILSVVLVSNIFVFSDREMNLKKQNDADKVWCNQIIENIEEYESKNQKIKQIYFCYDGNTDISVYGESAVSYDYSLRSMINFYSGRSFDVSQMTDEEKGKYFTDKEWDSINTSEQMVFESDTLYLCCY